MPAGDVLFNQLLTPHWVQNPNQGLSMSVNISHGGLRRSGRGRGLCCNEQELEAAKVADPALAASFDIKKGWVAAAAPATATESLGAPLAAEPGGASSATAQPAPEEGGTEAAPEPERPAPTLLARSAVLLASKHFREATRSVFRGAAIAMVNALGGPPMMLVPATRIEELGRIPRSSEGEARDALELIDNRDDVEVFFFSHRWLRPSADAATAHPDSAAHTKAAALIEFVKWRRAWVRPPVPQGPESHSCAPLPGTVRVYPRVGACLSWEHVGAWSRARTSLQVHATHGMSITILFWIDFCGGLGREMFAPRPSTRASFLSVSRGRVRIHGRSDAYRLAAQVTYHPAPRAQAVSTRTT